MSVDKYSVMFGVKHSKQWEPCTNKTALYQLYSIPILMSFTIPAVNVPHKIYCEILYFRGQEILLFCGIQISFIWKHRLFQHLYWLLAAYSMLTLSSTRQNVPSQMLTDGRRTSCDHKSSRCHFVTGELKTVLQR